jgi:poly(3-hydroxybutyrate) depolymerase
MRNLLLLLAVFTCVSVRAQQVAKSLTASNGVFIGFYEYKPANYSTSSTKKYPLIVFLHGIGERGNGTTELAKINANGITKNIAAGNKMTFTWNGKTETFLVLSPQLSAAYSTWPSFYVDAMIKYAKANLNIDTNRIIVTGLSLGGGGAWRYAADSIQHSRTLAAVGVSCGTYQSVNYCNIAQANLPVWAFHATDDSRVAVSATQNAIAAINNCNPAVKPYKTIWPTGDHTIWNRVYDTAYTWQSPNIYEWFLAQNKSLAPNKRPVAKAGADISVASTTGTATLDASKSTDADGTLVRFIWTQISGPSQSTIVTPVSTNGIASAKNFVAGTYEFEVKVVDNRADYTLDTVKVNVATAAPLPNVAPVTKAGADVTITLPTNSVTLDGSASSDADGSITSYKWTKVSGPASDTIKAATSSKTAITGLTQGSYTFQLTTTDNIGASSSDQVVVTVNAATLANKAPTAKAGANITITLPASSATLNGSSSSDADGSIASYAWSKVSGPTTFTIASKSSAKTGISGLVEGTYIFRLTVKDNSGASAYDDIAVYVNKGTTATTTTTVSATLVANAGANVILNLPANSTTLKGSATDKAGAVLKYKWTKLSGPASGTIAAATSASTAISGLAQGTYVFRLTVNDNSGSTDYDDIAVYVNSTASINPATAVQVQEMSAENVKADNKLSVYPNPARSYLDVQLSGTDNGNVVMNVYDVSGRMITRMPMEKSQMSVHQQMDVSRLAPGVYNLEAIVGGETRMVTRFVKQ